MKKLFVLLGLLFVLMSNNNTAESKQICLGIYVTGIVTVCNWVYVTHDQLEEKCTEVEVTFCKGLYVSFGTAEFDLPDISDPSVLTTQDVVLENVELEDGTFADFIIPAGEEAILDESTGYYTVNFYVVEK